MISPNDIRLKTERKYTLFLQSILQDIPFSKLVISGDKNPSKALSELQNEILALINQSKEKKGFGYSIEYKTVKTKSIGTQSLPQSIYFDTEKDFLKYLGKEKEVENFVRDYKRILNVFPELRDWMIKSPIKIIQYADHWENILKVCNYFKITPKPNLYIRELPIGVQTKFIETNQSIIKEILDILIELEVNKEEKIFEKRFNLKYPEPLVRFKILDKKISDSFFSGIDDVSIPVSQFQNLKMPLKRAIIVENKTSLYAALTLPKMEETIAIFGSGYGVANLKDVDWLSDVEILYWGDIDVQGFEILSQVRGYFPRTKSILMDEETFMTYFENDKGTPSTVSIKLILTDAEKLLYDKLKKNNWRLEQEKIPLEYANQAFQKNNFLSPNK